MFTGDRCEHRRDLTLVSDALNRTLQNTGTESKLRTAPLFLFTDDVIRQDSQWFTGHNQTCSLNEEKGFEEPPRLCCDAAQIHSW